MFKHGILLVAATVWISSAPGHAAPAASIYSSLFVLGDSLSDPGNLYELSRNTIPASPPYFEGRFSDGPVWAEYVAQDFAARGKPVVNLAVGGAKAVADSDGIPDLDLQIGQFAAPFVGDALRGLMGPKPVLSLLVGANDMFAAVRNAAAAPDPVAAIAGAAAGVAASVGADLRALGALGFKDFVLWSLPDLGTTPLLAKLAPAGVAPLGTLAAVSFNAQLAAIAGDLRGEGYGVVEIDLFGILAGFIADPGRFGFLDVDLPCVFPSAEAAALFGQPQVCDQATAGRLFFDDVHPNGRAHAIVADVFRTQAAAPVPLPAAGFLLIGALGGLVLVRRARRG
ncbi:MAG: SGNH/GDSL hydrolase family protein [Gemmobacter sp.]